MAVTLNLPDGLKEIATAYAEATQRSFSSLVEDLLRDHLNKRGALPEPTPEQVMERLREQLAAKKKRDTKKKKRASGSVKV